MTLRSSAALLLLLALISPYSGALAQFDSGHLIYVPDPNEYVEAFAFADMDGDGWDDYVSTKYWLKGGNDPVGDWERINFDQSYDPTNPLMVDFDADGDLDIAFFQENNFTFLLRNHLEAGLTLEVLTIDQIKGFCNLDGNEYPDVIGIDNLVSLRDSEEMGDSAVVHWNELPEDAGELARFEDINQDGFDDLVYWSGITLYCQLNLQDGSFETMTLYSALADIVAVDFCNLNADDYPDILLRTQGGPFQSSGISEMLYGTEQFGVFEDPVDPPTEMQPAERLFFGRFTNPDIDQIISISVFDLLNVFDIGAEGPLVTMGIQIDHSELLTDIMQADLNQDGLDELVYSSSSKLLVLDPLNDFQIQNLIYDKPTRIRGLQLHDLNGDGQQELFATCTESGHVSMWEDWNSPEPAEPIWVADVGAHIQSQLLVDDLNLDGVTEVFVLAGSTLWYMNVSDTGELLSQMSFSNVEKIQIADYDSDAYKELMVSRGFFGPSELLVLENEEGLLAEELTLVADLSTADFTLADIDLDLEQELLVFYESEVRVFERTADSYAEEYEVISGINSLYNVMAVADYTDDGYPDISRSVASQSIIYPLVDGLWTQETYELDLSCPVADHKIVDLDGNGTSDIVCGTFVHKRSLSGDYVTHQVLPGFPDEPSTTSMALVHDVNGDAKQDIIAGYPNGLVKYYLNSGLPLAGEDKELPQYTLEIAPSPSTGILLINGSTGSALGTISILDSSGKLVYLADQNEDQLELDLSGLPNGTYIARSQSRDGVFVGRFVLCK